MTPAAPTSTPLRRIQNAILALVAVYVYGAVTRP